MINVVFFLPSIGIGGAEISLSRIATDLLKNKKIKISIVVAKNLPKNKEVHLPDNLQVVYLGSKKTIYSIFKLVKYLRNQNPDIVLTTLPTSNFLVVILKKLNLIKSKVILREANSNYLYWKDGILNKIKGRLAVFAFNNSDGNIFISHELRDNLEKYVTNKNNTVIYNPVLTEDFFDRANEEIFDSKFNNKEIWITTSRLERQKGLDVLFKAAYKFLNERDFILLVVGGGSLETQLKKDYSDLPLKFLGNVDNPLKYLNLADIFFFPSRREGLGNSLIEAQILGKNIISSDCPSGPKEIIKIFNNGTLFKSESINDLIEAIESIELKEGRNVSKEIVDKFSVEKVSEQYFQILNNLI